ncbi:uncharacterized protein LOC141886207 [Acropora palmata]|uniref:uncharacterized protein LOC141886206 n=1 Tax=Acropora palmata TaxID=6131 RepID=UPI003DA0C364
MFLIRDGLMFVSFFPVIQWLSVFSFMFQPCAYNVVLFCPNLGFYKSERRRRMYYCIFNSSSIQGFYKSWRRTRMYYCISNSSSSQDSSQANEEVKNRNCKSDSMKGFFRRFFQSVNQTFA